MLRRQGLLLLLHHLARGGDRPAPAARMRLSLTQWQSLDLCRKSHRNAHIEKHSLLTEVDLLGDILVS